MNTDRSDHRGFTLTFGKYAGFTVGQVLDVDRQYCLWVLGRVRLWRDRRDDMEAIACAVADLLLEEVMSPGKHFSADAEKPARPTWQPEWGKQPSKSELKRIAEKVFTSEHGRAWLEANGFTNVHPIRRTA